MLLCKKISRKKHKKNLKYRVRRKGGSEKGDSTVDEVRSDAEDAAKLKQKLLLAQNELKSSARFRHF